MDKLRLLIIDEHPIVEEGLEHFLEGCPDIRIVATAGNGLDGLEQLRRIAVDIVILDLSLPKLDGNEAIRLYLEEKPDLGIIVYSGQKAETSVYRALKAGARGYILKSSPIPELIQAIREVHRGGYALSPSLNPAIIEFYLAHRDSASDRLAGYQDLTDREKQVFRLLANGRQTREIGEILCISPKTVAKHRVAIKRKLSLENVAQMAQYAMHIGLLDVQEPLH
jgi:two-component system response regulator NreC